jgi:hypothetical protein
MIGAGLVVWGGAIVESFLQAILSIKVSRKRERFTVVTSFRLVANYEVSGTVSTSKRFTP